MAAEHVVLEADMEMNEARAYADKADGAAATENPGHRQGAVQKSFYFTVEEDSLVPRRKCPSRWCRGIMIKILAAIIQMITTMVYGWQSWQ